MVSQYIAAHWIEWMFSASTIILGFLYRKSEKRMKEEQKKNKAVADGVQCLLRESIVSNYNKYATIQYNFKNAGRTGRKRGKI